MMSMLYINKDRLSLFDGLPSYLFFGDVTSATISGLDNGVAHAFAVRGLESFKDTFTHIGLQANSGGGYVFPSAITLSETMLDSDSRVEVESTDGYPEKGLLIISGSEVVKYSSKDETYFYLTPLGRD